MSETLGYEAMNVIPRGRIEIYWEKLLFSTQNIHSLRLEYEHTNSTRPKKQTPATALLISNTEHL